MKRKLFSIALLLLTALMILCGCQTPVEIVKDGNVYIAFVESEGVVAEESVLSVKRGSDVTFKFTVQGGYVFDDCTYHGKYTLAKTGENNYTMTMPAVRYDTRFTVTTNRVQGKIFYYLNGGTFHDETNTQEFFVKDIVLKNHLRLNTDIATSFKRDGYTQLGWNTRPDGNGEHVGLGSRVTVTGEESIVLYAEWSKWSDDSLFEFATNHESKETGDVCLTKYNGESEIDVLSIPAYINGKKVTCIEKGFTEGLYIKTLILPNTIDTVKINAFGKSTIDEIYLYDNVMNISNGSFGCAIPTAHINAIVPPKYIGMNNRSQFADKMDRLMLNVDKKKMILFGGCSMSYGVYSPTIEEAFNGEYMLIDMAINGGTNGWFQFLCMLPYIKDGDVFVHAPEQMSPYQFLHKLRAEERIFNLVDSNYDLLANIDLSRIGAFFDCFSEYNKIRKPLPDSNYDAYNADYNEYGDIIAERPNSPEDADYGIDPMFDMSILSEEAFANLNGVYGQMEAQGAHVLFSFAPLNKNALSDEDVATQSWLLFENKVKEKLDPAFPVISSAYDYLMEGKYFWDSDYHLSTEGTVIRTEMLLRDIQNALLG